MAFRTHYCYPRPGIPSPCGRNVTGGIKTAVEHARTVADGKNVELAGEPGIAQQTQAAGLVDDARLLPAKAGRLHSIETIPGEEEIHPPHQFR